MGEHDHLTGLRDLLQDPGQAVDLRGVQRLHGVVDDQEAERALVGSSAGDEQRQAESVQFALAHHTEGLALDAVHGDVDLEFASGAGADEGDIAEFHVALLPQLLTHLRGVGRERSHPLRLEGVQFRLEPALRLPERCQEVPLACDVSGGDQPAGQLHRQRLPPVLLLLQLFCGPGTRLQHGLGGRFGQPEEFGGHDGRGALRRDLVPAGQQSRGLREVLAEQGSGCRGCHHLADRGLRLQQGALVSSRRSVCLSWVSWPLNTAPSAPSPRARSTR